MEGEQKRLLQEILDDILDELVDEDRYDAKRNISSKVNRL